MKCTYCMGSGTIWARPFYRRYSTEKRCWVCRGTGKKKSEIVKVEIPFFLVALSDNNDSDRFGKLTTRLEFRGGLNGAGESSGTILYLVGKEREAIKKCARPCEIKATLSFEIPEETPGQIREQVVLAACEAATKAALTELKKRGL